MSEIEMSAAALAALIAEALYMSDEACDVVSSTSSFEEAGVLTRNDGLVVTLQDGTEFQVSVMRSR